MHFDSSFIVPGLSVLDNVSLREAQGGRGSYSWSGLQKACNRRFNVLEIRRESPRGKLVQSVLLVRTNPLESIIGIPFNPMSWNILFVYIHRKHTILYGIVKHCSNNVSAATYKIRECYGGFGLAINTRIPYPIRRLTEFKVSFSPNGSTNSTNERLTGKRQLTVFVPWSTNVTLC